MKHTKRLLCLLLAAVMLYLCACGNDGGSGEKKDKDTPQQGNEVGDLAYGGELTEISEKGVSLTTFDPTALGKITVINFWAYWCGPCTNEMPHFNQVAKEYADEVAVVAVHCDDLEQGQAFIGANYPDSPIRFAMDDEDDRYGYYEKLGGTGSIPYTVVLDADGIIRNTFVGAIDYDTLVEAIEDCREEKKTPTTTQRQPALKRGNEVGDVCYGADLKVITAEGIQEETVDPTSFGKVTVINFWYTTCGPCVAEMPYFDEIAKKYASSIKAVAVHGMMVQTAPAYIAEHYSDSPIVFLSDFIPEGDNTTELDRTGYYTMLGGVNNAYPRTVILNEMGIITHIFSHSVTQQQLETAVLEAMGRM